MKKIASRKERQYLHAQYTLKLKNETIRIKNQVIKQQVLLLDEYRQEIKTLEWKNEQLKKRLNEKRDGHRPASKSV